MNKYILSLFMTFFSFSIMPCSAENNPPVITNDDLMKYKKPSDNSPVQKQSIPTQTYKNQLSERQNQTAFDSWCNKGTKYSNEVTKAKNNLDEADKLHRAAKHEHEIFVLYKGKMGKPNYWSEGNLNNAKNRLRQAKENLSELENEAHRKNIRPGWLRCQE